METFSRRDILGVRIDDLSSVEVVDKIESLIETGRFCLGVTINPEILMAARQDKEFLEIINHKTAFVTADGVGITLAGKLLGQPFREKVTGNDLIEPLAGLCSRKKWPLMLMGGKPGVAQKALENLKVKYPRILGIATSHPISGSRENEILFLTKLIKKEKPAVVLAALDFGTREKFLVQYIKQLKEKDFPRGIVFLGIGGAFDYLAGVAKRAPLVWQKWGLEWLWRLITQPRLRFRRQMETLPLFGFLILRESFQRKFLRRFCEKSAEI